MTELKIRGNNLIPSLQPLKELTKLTTLHLQLDMEKVEGVEVAEVAIDLSPLASMKELQSFHLDTGERYALASVKVNPGDTLVTLSSLENIKDLHLKNVTISDASFLDNMTGLTSLLLSDNDITDLQSLSELTNMEELRLYDNDIITFQPLEKLTKITILKVVGVPVTNVDAIGYMSELRILKLLRTDATDISALANASKLQGLSLGRSYITDLTALTELPLLEAFIYLELGVTDLNVFNNFQSLKILTLSEGDDVDYLPLYGWTNLITLNIQLNESFNCSDLISLKVALPGTNIINTLECEG